MRAVVRGVNGCAVTLLANITVSMLFFDTKGTTMHAGRSAGPLSQRVLLLYGEFRVKVLPSLYVGFTSRAMLFKATRNNGSALRFCAWICSHSLL